MKLTDHAISEFNDIFGREYGVVLSRDESEAIIRNLVTLYRSLYEWYYHRRQGEHRNEDAGS